MKNLQLSVSTLISNLLTPQERWKVVLLSHWQELLGSLHQRVTLEKIENTFLVLGVYDSAWMQELYLLSPLLLEMINKKLGEKKIQSLRFKKIARAPISSEKKTIATPYKKVAKALSSSEQKAVEQIKNDALRVSILEFRDRCLNERIL